MNLNVVNFAAEKKEEEKEKEKKYIRRENTKKKTKKKSPLEAMQLNVHQFFSSLRFE